MSSGKYRFKITTGAKSGSVARGKGKMQSNRSHNVSSKVPHNPDRDNDEYIDEEESAEEGVNIVPEDMDEESSSSDENTYGRTIIHKDELSFDPLRIHEKAQKEEEQGIIEFLMIYNDGTRRNLEMLTTLKEIFAIQLPFMPKDYIWRLLFDPLYHRSLVITRGRHVIGGICFRTFRLQQFIEIVFCAIAKTEQVKGYGKHLMNHLKESMRLEQLLHFLTYADNNATEYFRKQGFTFNVSYPEFYWRPYIKDYKGGTLMECVIEKNISYLSTTELVCIQKNVLLKILNAFVESDPSRRAPIERIKKRKEAEDRKRGSNRCESINENKMLITDISDLLYRVKSHHSSWPFRVPVNLEIIPDYLEIVPEPIDLVMIEQKVISNQYRTRDDFVNDLLHMIDNCKAFNGTNSDNIYTNAAYELEDFIKAHVFISEQK